MLKFYPILYATLFTLCSGFVLISSADGSFDDLPFFTLGQKLTYKWRSTVRMNEIADEAEDEGFNLDGKVAVSPVWRDENKWLIKFELLQSTLYAESKKGKQYKSPLLKSYRNQPFAAIINKGIIEKVYIGNKEETVLKNLKKALISLFQFNSNQESETDISGRCQVSYKKLNSKYIKTKTDCTSDLSDHHKHLDPILGTKTKSSTVIKYSIHDDPKRNSIFLTEQHSVQLQAKEHLGGTIATQQELTYEAEESVETIRADNAQDALAILSFDAAEENLMAENVDLKLKNKLFSKEVALLREQLKTKHLGTEQSAKAFLQLLEVVKTSDADDISKALASKKNSEILDQLYDILGYAQTENTHKAVMKLIHLDNEEQVNLVERYLWALSFSIHPNLQILEDLLNKFRKNPNIVNQVKDTLVLTLGSIARRATQKAEKLNHVDQKIFYLVQETIINGYDYAKDQERHVYLNALKNLRSPSTIPKLFSVLNNGTQKEEVLAWRAIKSFGNRYWSEDILSRAEKTLFQLDRRHDTSARCLAVDVLLNSSPSDDVLEKILHFVAKNDGNYEIRQYAFQSIMMLAEKCPEFEKRVKDIVKSNSFLNNYSSLAPRGLSTALTRNIYKGTASNGHLVSLQEVKGGLVKRGVVDVVLDNHETTGEIFTLGIFAGGLSSFSSSTPDEHDDPEEEEDASTGMELTVLGTQIRPFVFFESQGELMGLIWSGTASDMTPAFQALILVQEHEDTIRLSNGFIVKIDIKGALSFDLSGKMEVSLWNRNAQSLIKKSVAYSVKGLLKIDTPLVKKELSFEANTEPQLNLELDADVSGKAKLCMRLSQPDSVFRQETVKGQSIPDTDYQSRKSVKRKMEIPGVTYAINRKNNENCAAMFNS
ncbi:microsomal triacylglycerol transfer protein [Anthonomus grandis grandis]|uniref:microsomal triacylglycerol transfer protein n=1 Tax=Anthonomus grandis grandis TaxID=2921223 RepID=UPI0021655BD8|nr:microsomal triacylglycerol transfer protein [Anthonomus grandis grandis]XP_050308346.1 microsomal triacylglycerol transfer protein [Anthonomus grandis grandis]